LFHAAELQARLAAGLFFPKAGKPEFGDLLLDVETQFRMKISFLSISPE
jgi:hypothetical protein